MHITGVLHGGQAEWDGRILVGSIVLCVGGWDPAATPLSKHIIRGLAVSACTDTAALCSLCAALALLPSSNPHSFNQCLMMQVRVFSTEQKSALCCQQQCEQQLLTVTVFTLLYACVTGF
jgi:hypothetical protein